MRLAESEKALRFDSAPSFAKPETVQEHAILPFSPLVCSEDIVATDLEHSHINWEMYIAKQGGPQGSRHLAQFESRLRQTPGPKSSRLSKRTALNRPEVGRALESFENSEALLLGHRHLTVQPQDG
jgi:hypothetical protein